jgi:hypothetical protein
MLGTYLWANLPDMMKEEMAKLAYILMYLRPTFCFQCTVPTQYKATQLVVALAVWAT